MNVEAYLKGKVGIAVNDSTISAILVDRQVHSGIDVTDIDKQVRDLCVADLYMWCASLPSTMGSVSDADGGWKHSEGGTTMSKADREAFRIKANVIYSLYGESVSESASKMKIQML